VLSLDLIDITGELQRGISHSIVNTRLTAEGTAVPGSQTGELRNDIDKLNEQRASGYCGSCYGGESPRVDAVTRATLSARRTFERVGASATLVQLTRCASFPSHRVPNLRGHSALRNTGRTKSRSSHRRVATSPVSYE
jgi:hypothetical protein